MHALPDHDYATAMSTKHDLIVIGGGPGGYVAAIRAAQLGMNVACIDKNPVFGGTCLRVGCIPSKALLESSERYEETAKHLDVHGISVKDVKLDLKTMLGRKDQVVKSLTEGIGLLFKKNKITGYNGTGEFVDAKTIRVNSLDGSQTELTADHIIIATGSKPASLPGVNLEDELVDSNSEAIDYDNVPKHLAVIGGGYIGIELGSVWRRLGSKVTVIEYLDRIFPGFDSELAKEALKLFKKQGLEFKLGHAVTGVKANAKSVTISVKDAKSDKDVDPIKADRVLVAVGRKPFTDGLGLDNAGVKTDERGYIPVDGQYQTNVKGVYAIGDVIPTAMLAHVAEEEGIACVEHMVTNYGHVNYDVIPAIVYTHPELAMVGKTEDQLKEEDIAYRKGKFHFRGNGRAFALNDTEGLVKVLADKSSDRVLGVHIVGPRAGDLIAECAAAMEFHASAEDIARLCHAHPTLSEAVKEAAMAVDGRQIHG